MPDRPKFSHDSGFTYTELLLAVVVASLLAAGLSGVVGQALQTREVVHNVNELSRQAGFAMQRMERAIAHSRHLLLPLADNLKTNWPEHIREQTVPPSAPIGDSTLATAVLAITLPAWVDNDTDGFPDGDNDRDGLIDEDVHADNNLDSGPGISGIDDNGDGVADNTSDSEPADDNDEDGQASDDSLNGLDDDGDGSIDEDLRSDMNYDSKSGISGVDDDADGAVDEANRNDDDEDGRVDEDWYDSWVFYLQDGVLKERIPLPWDANGDGVVNGKDTQVNDLASWVSRFRVERVQRSDGRGQLIDLTLELTHPEDGRVIALHTQVRLGGAL